MKRKHESMDFDFLVGQSAKLYLADNSAHRFQLGSVLFEVMEDEEDGYRSSMEEVRIIEDKRKTKGFLADVIIHKNSDGSFYGYSLVEGNHIWLRFGTDNVDDYYPSFVFDWQPRLPKHIEDIVTLIKK